MENKTPFKGRLTSKRLVGMVNDLFAKYEIEDYICTRIVRTNFTSDQYEGGACKLYIYFTDKVQPENPLPFPHNEGTIMSFYFIKEIEDHLRAGYELYFYVNSRFGGRSVSLSELELDLKKPK